MITKLTAGMGGMLAQAAAAAAGCILKDHYQRLQTRKKLALRPWCSNHRPLPLSAYLLHTQQHAGHQVSTVGHLVTHMHMLYDSHMPEQ